MVNLIYSNSNGKIFENPGYSMLGCSGFNYILPTSRELIKLPPYSKLFFIPDSPAIGFNPTRIDHPKPLNPTRVDHPKPLRMGLKDGSNKKTGQIEPLDKNNYAVSAFLPPGYLRTLLPATGAPRACTQSSKTFTPLVGRRPEPPWWCKAPPTHGRSPWSYGNGIEFKKPKKFLPLWAYTAAGIKENEFYACAVRIDKYEKWSPENYDDRKLPLNAKKLKIKFKDNSLYKQLFKCATRYHCFTAKNFFMGYAELAVPLSARCNASCIGCISLQTETDFPSSQERITKTPTLKEVLEIIQHHIHTVTNPIISFGQGCEGEPLLETELISEIIKTLKSSYKNATFNINTNGSLTKNLKSLIKAGLDTARVSINSAIKERYNSYFRPKGYDFEDVINSIKTLKESRVFVMLNILTFPGVSDEPNEIDALVRLIQKTKPDMLQLRNLNIDPRLYLALIKPKEKSTGIINFLKTIKKTFPELKVGSFNRPKSYFK